MRNKKLLNTLVLFGVCASLFSLASCQGIKGEQGEPGTPGVDGKPGEDGKDGEDGNTWLTGEGTPASSLGKNGDLYLDTATSDYYIKKDGSWVKTGNLKGEDGEDGKPGENGKPGEDGEDGLNGSTGPKGDTAWSNTVLPTSHGTIAPSVGSATVGSKFQIYLTPESNYVLSKFSLDGGQTLIEENIPLNNGVYTYETTMQENGFVIFAEFSSKLTNGENAYINGVLHSGVIKDNFGNIFSEGQVVNDAPAFAEGSGNGESSETPLIVNSADSLKQLSTEKVQNTDSTYFKLSSDVSFEESDNSALISFVSSSETTEESKVINLDLGGKKVTLPSNESTLASTNEKITIQNGVIDYKNTSGKYDQAVIATTEGGEIELDGVTLTTNGTPIVIGGETVSGSGSSLVVKNSTIIGDRFGVTSNAAKDYDENASVTIENSTIYGVNSDNDTTAVLLNENITTNIVGSKLYAGRQAIVARGGTVNLTNVELNLTEGYSNLDLYHDGNWKSGNEVPAAYITVGDNGSLTNGYPASASVSLTNVSFNKIDSVNTNSLLSETTTSTTEYPYIYAWGKTDNLKTKLTIDSTTYSRIGDRIKIGNDNVEVNVSSNQTVKENVFIAGQLYSKAVSIGSKFEAGLSVIVPDVKFMAGGSGTSADPLLVSSYEELNLLKNTNVTVLDELYLKLNNNIEVRDLFNHRKTVDNKEVSVPDAIGKNVVLDLDGKTITAKSGCMDFKDGKLTIKNGYIKEEATTSGDQTYLCPNSASTFILDDVELTTKGSGIFPSGNANKVVVNNTKIVSSCYGIATNRSTTSNVKISITDSTIETIGADFIANDDNFEYDDAAVFINTNGEVTIKNSSIKANRIAIGIRAGSAELEDVKIEYTNKYASENKNAKLRYTGSYGSGNEIACAAISVGNRGTGIDYDVIPSLTMKNVTVSCDDTTAVLLWAEGRTEDYKATVNMDSSTQSSVIKANQAYCNDNAEIMVDGSVIQVSKYTSVD